MLFLCRDCYGKWQRRDDPCWKLQPRGSWDVKGTGLPASRGHLVTCDSSQSLCPPGCSFPPGIFSTLLDSVHGIILLGVKKFETWFLLNAHHFHTMSKKSQVIALISGASLSLILLLVLLCSVWFLSPPSSLCLSLITAPLPSWKLLSGRVYLHPQMKPQVCRAMSSDYLCLHPSHNFPIIAGPQSTAPMHLCPEGTMGSHSPLTPASWPLSSHHILLHNLAICLLGLPDQFFLP